MDMFEEAKSMGEKVDVNPTPLVSVTAENISSMVVAYVAIYLEESGKVFDEIGMTEEFQAVLSKVAEVAEGLSG